MPDLEGLKQRIELIDARLKTAHVARERESTALSDIWDQIRERYLDQMTEIDRMRQQINELEETKNELTNLIQVLLTAVETNLERASDETVPKIKEMADTLMSATPAEIGNLAYAPRPTGKGVDLKDTHCEDLSEKDLCETDELISAIEESLNDEDSDDMAVMSGDAETDRVTNNLSEKQSVALSPGIRDLIGRIEEAVGPVSLEADEDETIPSAEIGGLSKDLQEIEELRSELMGLRGRIASNG